MDRKEQLRLCRAACPGRPCANIAHPDDISCILCEHNHSSMYELSQRFCARVTCHNATACILHVRGNSSMLELFDLGAVKPTLRGI